MEQHSLLRGTISDALWLWATLAAGIGLGTIVTAFAYALGISESSALTAGFIAMATLLVVSEVLYRAGVLPLAGPRRLWTGPGRRVATRESPSRVDYTKATVREALTDMTAQVERGQYEALRAVELEHEKQLERLEHELEALRAKEREHEKEIERLQREVRGQGPSASP